MARSCLRRPTEPRATPGLSFECIFFLGTGRLTSCSAIRLRSDVVHRLRDRGKPVVPLHWGGSVVACLAAGSLCTTPTLPPSSAAWPLGAAAQAAALTQNPGAWLKPRPTGAWQPTGNNQRLLRLRAWPNVIPNTTRAWPNAHGQTRLRAWLNTTPRMAEHDSAMAEHDSAHCRTA